MKTLYESILDDIDAQIKKGDDDIKNISYLYNTYKPESFNCGLMPNQFLNFLKQFDYKVLKKYTNDNQYSFSVFREYNKRPITTKIELLINVILNNYSFEEGCELIIKNHPILKRYEIKPTTYYDGIDIRFYDENSGNLLMFYFEKKHK